MLIGVLIKKKRLEKKLGLRELDRLSGINHGQLHQIENSSNNNIQLNTLMKICRAMDIKVFELLREEDV